ncbi:chorismate--pyruvate lyase [Methylomarinovum tepidoasis]|uniref:Probable chorismate pyruvate-lyase n=1 Tax=Methylomarinovum tepidoasis TaxID=2840183 RepID=A0AAU9CSI1_9GAMM|nr:chorismate lyase [Methylomarinovum sp. IN45]BCX89313.1 chorismate--pyruvate lyase [Methylomarinovum sp. IN45]
MKPLAPSLLLANDPHWFVPGFWSARRPPLQVLSWLAETGSLTARLQALAGTVEVQVLRQGRGRALASERCRLAYRPRLLWVREVVLAHRGTPLLAARTVAPPATLKGAGAGVARLGTRPLGALLFTDPGVRRRGCEWTRLVSRNWKAPLPRPDWGRRILYTIDGRPLLVAEFFLPSLFELAEATACSISAARVNVPTATRSA